jgi:hypothetical protein
MRRAIHRIIIVPLAGLLFSGIAYGDFPDSLNLGDLKPGQRVTITFKVTVNTDVHPNTEGVSNHGRIFGDNFNAVYTDDPDTPEVNDPTETPIEPIFTMAMDLPKDWSMISLPLSPYNARSSGLFPEAIALYGFEKEFGYVRVRREEELEVGNGHWILFDQNQNYLLTGEPAWSYAIPVYENGWDMIGGCTYPAQALSDNCDIVVIYGYTQGKGYQRILESEIEPGKGYWILFSNVLDQAELRVETKGQGL